MVPKVRTRRRAPPPASVTSTHATTVFLCTSSPQHRSWTICIAATSRSDQSASRRGRAGVRITTSFPHVLTPGGAATTPHPGRTPSANFLVGLAAPRKRPASGHNRADSIARPAFSCPRMSGADMVLFRSEEAL